MTETEIFYSDFSFFREYSLECPKIVYYMRSVEDLYVNSPIFQYLKQLFVWSKRAEIRFRPLGSLAEAERCHN
jgi:hypothetical protein